MTQPSHHIDKPLFILLIVLATFFGLTHPALAQGPIYVDKNATSGANNGTDWANAYTDLQSALGAATSGDEIWVAEGVYTPGLNRSDTFTLSEGIQLYGGFAGSEASRDERAWTTNRTVLSGDIGGDDLTDASGVVTTTAHINGDNSYHIVWADGKTGDPINETTVLDGFIITAGQATGSGDDDKVGGGFYCAGDGSGNQCSPSLSNLTFIGNFATDLGGAVFNSGYDSGESSPVLTNISFLGNVTGDAGGAIFNDGFQGSSSPTLLNVIFSGNQTAYGGAIYNSGSFFGESSPSLINVTFANNSATTEGGAMHNAGDVFGKSSPSLINTIFWANTAPTGNQLYNSEAAPIISYTLIPNDSNDIVNQSSNVTYGSNVVNDDPLFVDALGLDRLSGTLDDDLRLFDASPAIDAGDNTALPSGLITDVGGDPRFYDDTDVPDTGNGTTPLVDIGAYERQSDSFCVSPLYVDRQATGDNSGLNWDDAFTDLQTALNHPLVTTCPAPELWITRGVHTPGSSQSDHFTLTSGTQLYGGFVGTETSRDQRNWESYPTILSGDIDRDDTTDIYGVVSSIDDINGTNSYHVVVLDGTGGNPITADTVLDGVIITAGVADDTSDVFNQRGGGLYCNGGGSGSECSPTLDNLTFSGNLAQDGGAMFNDGAEGGRSNPDLSEITFIGNEASNGGAIFNNGVSGDSSPSLTDVTFQGNQADFTGGAIVNTAWNASGRSNPTLHNVTFVGNSAHLFGGGGAIFNYALGGAESSPSLTNVLFSGNSAPSGGAIYHQATAGSDSQPTLINVTFANNTATDGGAMYNAGDPIDLTPILTNVILWGNTATGSGSQIYNDATTPVISYSLIQSDAKAIANVNGASITYGPNIVTSDPLFNDALGDDGISGTLDDDLSLGNNSPATDAGDNGAISSAATTDLDGNSRFFDDVGVVDTGNGSAPIVDMGAYERQAKSCANTSGTIYVNHAAMGANNGNDWTNAFVDLQNGLTLATDCAPIEVWVAQGIYTPGLTQSDTFSLTANVQVYGGFVGSETERDQRDWEANPTILSGDIDGNDTTDANGVVITTDHINGDNSYHVVSADGGWPTPYITPDTILDGFTITAGQANGTDDDSHGGGLHCEGSGPPAKANQCSPTLRNLNFYGNLADLGGAIFVGGVYVYNVPLLENVTFSGNSARNGGAMHNSSGSGTTNPTLRNVTFIDNTATSSGGAIYNNGHFSTTSPKLFNVTFFGNSANSNGGAMYNYGASDGESDPSLENVLFSRNTAGNNGGAMYNQGRYGQSNPTLTNVTFANNTATNLGGAMYNNGSEFAGNLGQSQPTLNNVILWGNTAKTGSQLYNEVATPIINYTLIQSDSADINHPNAIVGITSTVTYGDGIVTDDPRFTDALGADGVSGTSDDDLRLSDGSPAIDVGDNSVVTESTDLAGDTRIRHNTVDLGAYEAPVFDLTLTQVGSGTVTVEPAQSAYYSGTVITLTAVVSDATTFGWSGDLSGGSSPISLMMDSDKVVTATFTASGVSAEYQVYLPLVVR